jgi:hypothetical protein
MYVCSNPVEEHELEQERQQKVGYKNSNTNNSINNSDSSGGSRVVRHVGYAVLGGTCTVYAYCTSS